MTAKKPAKSRTAASKAEGKEPEAAPPPTRPPGRPSTFRQEIADEICERLSKGEPLEVICRDDHIPPVRTVNHWREAKPEFMADIARAREEGYDAIAVQCLDIADDTEHDTLFTDNGDRPNTEWISRSKLRIDTRLKLLAKWDPKRYGDRAGVVPEQPGDKPADGIPTAPEYTLTPDEPIPENPVL